MDIFVIATGPSLLKLTEEEVNYINQCPNVCVNRYPIFWDLVGIKPKNYIYLDINQKTNSILEGVIEKCGNIDMTWITSSEHKELIGPILEKYSITKDIKFTLVDIERNRSKFIDDFNGRLFWSSITGAAINAATILHPDHNIKVVGLDGGDNTHFWIQSLYDTPDKYKNKFYKMQRENIKMPHNSMNMLTWGLPIIKREVSKRGVDIFNCNEQSEWVKNNSMRFAKIVT